MPVMKEFADGSKITFSGVGFSDGHGQIFLEKPFINREWTILARDDASTHYLKHRIEMANRRLNEDFDALWLEYVRIVVDYNYRRKMCVGAALAGEAYYGR